LIWAAFALSVLIISLFAAERAASSAAERRAPPVGLFAEIEGHRLHYLDIGNREAPPVLLIHGASVNMRDMQIALGDALAPSHRVIIVDRPGRGYSARPEDGWRLAVQARLLRGLLDHLGVVRPVVVGQSFGGAVALAYAIEFPEATGGLVLLAPVSHEWPGAVAWYNRVSGWPAIGPALRRLVIPFYAPLAARPGVEKSFLPNKAPENYYENSGLSLLFRPSDFKANAADLRGLKAEVTAMSPRYRDITAPTYLLTGADDRTVSPKIHSNALSEAIPGIVFALLDDTGHAIHHARRDAVLRAISEAATKAHPTAARLPE